MKYAAKQTEHTPTPWNIGYGSQDGDNYAVINSPLAQYPICMLDSFGYLRENADFIVEAVNSHDKLRTDRDALLAAYKAVFETERLEINLHEDVWNLLNAAIEQAEKEG